MTYCYVCPNGHRFTAPYGQELCVACESTVRRDWQAESVGLTGLVEMKRQRELGLDGRSGKEQQRDIFLPTADDYRSPEDPTGQKGLRDWCERHGPRPSNKHPLYPELEKKVF